MRHSIPIDVALAMWADFPVDRTPRPLVLTGEDIVGPDGGFRDTVLKEAFCDGAFEPPATFPSGPSVADGVPLLSAELAFGALLTAGDRQGCQTTLAVTDMQLESASFATDRGWRRLPAWLVSLRDVDRPVAVLAVGPEARFIPANVARPSQIGARQTPDGRMLRIGFVGGPVEHYDYAADAVESSTAVAVHVDCTRAPSGFQRALGYSREVPVTLQALLGARVLVDAVSGAPAPVTA